MQFRSVLIKENLLSLHGDFPSPALLVDMRQDKMQQCNLLELLQPRKCQLAISNLVVERFSFTVKTKQMLSEPELLTAATSINFESSVLQLLSLVPSFKTAKTRTFSLYCEASVI